jgi:hypothetical protein
MVPVNECYTLLRGDGPRRADIQSCEVRLSDGATRCRGVMRADTPEGLALPMRPPEPPFDLMIPAGLSQAEFHFKINVPIYYKLKNGESLIGLDFTPPPPPPPVQAQPNWGGLALGIVGLLCIGIAASRN